MRLLPLGAEIWGAFLIMVGVALLVFNRRWAAWATPETWIQLIAIAPSVKAAVGRVMTVVVGLMFLAVGASIFFGDRPGIALGGRPLAGTRKSVTVEGLKHA